MNESPWAHQQSLITKNFRLIAILGGSGSGKSTLGLEIAQELNCEIFSLDSLAIYQDFDIVSAKPTPKELNSVFHYAINILKPDQNNNAMLFRELLLQSIGKTQSKGKNVLLIIGGSSFYLKSLIEGLSTYPILAQQQEQEIIQKINALSDPHAFLCQIDPQCTIHPNDTYRINRALEIFFHTSLPPSVFFKKHLKKCLDYPIEKYAIQIEREILRERIQKRTNRMLKDGLLEEIKSIYSKYGYQIQPSKAIGVQESIEFLTQTPLEILQNQAKPKRSQKIIAKNIEELLTLISTHTAQLAKRQTTFNRTQFGVSYSTSCSNPKQSAQDGIIWGNSKELKKLILALQ